MDVKLMLTEKEIPASYVYDYADREGVTPLLKMHTLGHSFALSIYDALLAGKLKDFAYSEEKVEEAIVDFPRFLPGSIYY